MADETTKIQLELDASVKNLAQLQAAEKQISALIAAYRKLSEAMEAGKSAAAAKGSKGYSSELKVSEELANARASLKAIDDISRKIPGGLEKAGPAGRELAATVNGLKTSLATIASPTGTGSAAAVGATLGKAATWAEGKIKGLTESLDQLQKPAKGPGKKGAAGDPGGALAQAEKQVRDLEALAGKSLKVTEGYAQQSVERGESPKAAQARAETKTAADSAVTAAQTEAAAKKETAKAAKTVAEETGKSAKNAKAVAEQTTATTKAATKVAAQVSPKATPSEISASLGGPLRSLLSQASRDPMGPVNRPTRRELEGASNLPIANKLAGRTMAGGPGDGGASNSLRNLATSAERASAALSRLASSTAGSAKAAVGGSAPASAASAAAPKSILSQIQQEAAANREGAAALHKVLRQQEALSNPKYKQAVQQRAASQVTYAQSVNAVAAASNNAGRAMQGVVRQQDAIAGQIKNVIGMAAGYQVLQGIASELGQIFGHLKGGIIGFNSMLEQATVGFTTLFENQEKQALAAGKGMSEAQSLTEDVSAKIDYIRMGYGSAEEAAKGLIGTIREFANVTPFRFAELQESALRMRAFGFALDEVLRKNPETGKFEGGIVAVGNAVSALGGGADSFRRITYALGQMKQAGRVYQNDMMQLANAGIGGYTYIANKLKKEITTDGSGSRKMVKAEYRKLFNDLSSNAIETVRRLTSSGQISGEAASRAILEGLETDFGGGMEKQARTFAGAFSTVADTSQSLVADAFLPLYNSIRDTTVALGDFLQKDDVRKRAVELGAAVTVIVEALTKLGTQVMSIVVKSFGDLSNIINNLGNKTKATGQVFTMAFGGLASGISVVLSLLENDMFRALIYAGALTKALFAFTASNPMLTQILLVTTAIGLLKQAYESNFAGVGDAVDNVVNSLEPMLAVIRDQIIPLAARLGSAFSSTLFTAIAGGFSAIAPAIQAVVTAVELFLRVVKMLEGPLSAIFLVLGASFVFGKLVGGLAAVGRQIGLLMISFDQLANKARNAGAGLRILPNAPYGGTGVAPLKYDGKAPTAVSNLATAAERAATALLKVAGAGSGTTAGRRGAAGSAGAAGAAAVVATGAPVGASSPLVTRGSVASGLMTATGGMGMAAMLIGGLMQTGDEATAAIGSTVMSVGMGLSAFAALKSIVPPGMMGQIASGLKMILTNLKAMALMQFPGLAAGAGKLKSFAMGIPMIAQLGTAFSGMFAGVTAGAVAATAGVALLAVGFVLLIKAISDKLAEEKAKRDGERAATNQAAMNDVLGTELKAPTAEDYLNVEKSKEAAARQFQGGAGSKDFNAAYKAIEEGKSFKVEIDRGALGLGIGMGTDEEKEARRKEQQDAIDRVAAYNKRLREYQELMSNPMTQKYYKQARLDYEANLTKQSEKTKGLVKDTADAMGLLVNQQKNAAKNQEYLNWLLAKAKQEMAVATTAMQTLAEGAMQAILNPASRVNPYTGLEEAGLTLDEQLQIEQEMGFAQATNAQGLVRNFDEYRDLLDSILPITDKDLVNGQLSVKAVEERLKIDKERKKELEHIKAIAEAEYDLGMAQLSMYDESIDPLQRGVQMRQAQMKYAEDINKLQSEGVEIVLDQVKASSQWSAATKATQKRLEDLKKGQQLVLDEMKNMFNDYNQDIANILSNPSLSATQRKNQVEERVKQLYDDLEKNFGVTKDMMQTQLTSMNSLIDGALANIGNPTMPDINWGGELANKMEAGGYKFLTDYLVAKAMKVADLTSAVFAAANPDEALDKYAIKTRDVLVKLFKARIATGIAEGKLEKDTGMQSVAGRLHRDISYFAKTTGFENLVTFQNQIEAKLKNLGLARGGYTGAGQLHLVGEQGPELFVPRSNGMVLSNSISTKLMGMLGGGGMAMAGANNVTINVNNPVIRSDNDIRKLANEISKAQASQFRVNGGRLS